VIRSLSVLLPVRNLQSSLSTSVHEILDVMAELTSRFELVIIDEASTDGTWEVARELAQLYPQVRSLRTHVAESAPAHSNRISERRTQVRAAQGDVVIAHDGSSPIDAHEIVRLWRSLAASTRAPKFLSTPGVASANRTLTSQAVRSAGFRVLRPGASEDPRRAIPTFGVR
jgi:glycosyltransferase involved in cell wall biosynthesis